jgi:nitrous oxide reductase accessory protein NosL
LRASNNFRFFYPFVVEDSMNKSLLLASLIAVAALAACGKKEEAPVAPAPAPVAAPASEAAPMAAPASEAASAAEAASK